MKTESSGNKVEIGAFRGIVHPDFNTPQFLKAVADCGSLRSDSTTRVLLDKRNRVIATSIPVSEERSIKAVIKEFRASGFKRLKTLVSQGKAAKAWQGAVSCEALRIPTPVPYGYLERRARGVVAESYFVAEYIENAREIRSLFQTSTPAELSSLLPVLAEFLVLCHGQGILHRDLSDGNILVRPEGETGFRFWLIDTNRIRVRRNITLLSRVRNLIRLGIPPFCQGSFLDLYLGGRGGHNFLRFWYRWNKKIYAGFLIMKKKLRLRKIAESLRIQ